MLCAMQSNVLYYFCFDGEHFQQLYLPIIDWLYLSFNQSVLWCFYSLATKNKTNFAWKKVPPEQFCKVNFWWNNSGKIVWIRM